MLFAFALLGDLPDAGQLAMLSAPMLPCHGSLVWVSLCTVLKLLRGVLIIML